MKYHSPSRRVERIPYQNGYAWVKHACYSKKTFWHRLQRILSYFIPLSILRPTVSLGGESALSHEINQLRKFKEYGLVVPHILEEFPDKIILSDIGLTLKEHLQKETSIEGRLLLLKNASRTLAEMHNLGLYHGRPHIKDIVYQPDTKQIGFLDLEENPLSVMSLNDAQDRDFWLFLCSCGRYIEHDVRYIEGIASSYLSQRNMPSPPKNLIILAKILKPLRYLVEKFLYNVVGHDVRNVVVVNKMLEQRQG